MPPVVASPHGGMSKAKLRNLDGAPQQVATTTANLYGLQVHNNQNADAWIQVFDKTNPVPGTDTPDKEFLVRALTSREFSFQPQGSQFQTAISVCSTTTEKGAIGTPAGVHVFVDFA